MKELLDSDVKPGFRAKLWCCPTHRGAKRVALIYPLRSSTHSVECAYQEHGIASAASITSRISGALLAHASLQPCLSWTGVRSIQMTRRQLVRVESNFHLSSQLLTVAMADAAMSPLQQG